MTTGGEGSSASGRADGASGARRTGGAGAAALGVEALVEVQRRGLQAAGDLVDRLVRAVDGPDPPAEPDAPGAPAAEAGTGAPASAGDDALEKLARAWTDWVRLGLSVFDRVGASGDGTVADPAPATRPDDARAPAAPAARVVPDAPAAGVTLANGRSGVVRVVAVPDGAAPAGRRQDAPVSGCAEVWLHNRGQHDRAGITVHAGPLLCGDGTALPADAVALSPTVVDLPAQASRGVTVTVRTRAAPGTYRGVVVASEPDAWLALEVAVAHGPRGNGDGDDGR